MSNEEIKFEIDRNNEQIHALLNPANFTLNTVINQLLSRNKELMSQCTHEFVDGICKYCYKGEETQ